MRRRFFWGMVGVAVVTLTVGGFAAACLINRSVQESVRDEFDRQAAATARLIKAEPIAGRARGARDAHWAQLLRIVGRGRRPRLRGGRAGGAARDDHRCSGTESVLIDQVPGHRLDRATRSLRHVGGRRRWRSSPSRFPARGAGHGGGVDRHRPSDRSVDRRPAAVRSGHLLLAVLLAALLAGRLARRAGERLEALRDATAELAGGDLSARVPVDGDDEVAEVEVAFNEMADQLEEARRREREFLVSVCHDLRTPLTTIGGYTEALEEGKIADEDSPGSPPCSVPESARLGQAGRGPHAAVPPRGPRVQPPPREGRLWPATSPGCSRRSG